MNKTLKRIMIVILSVLLVVSSIVCLPAMAETSPNVTNEFTTASWAETLYGKAGENLLKDAKAYGKNSASDPSIVEKTAWAGLTDGIVNTAAPVNISASAFDTVYFPLKGSTEVSKIIIYNFTGWNVLHQLASFDVYIADSPEELWGSSSLVCDYDISEGNSADFTNKGLNFITIDFSAATKPQGKYVGFKWNDPYNFAAGSSGVVLSEIALFGTSIVKKYDVERADKNNSEIQNYYDSLLTANGENLLVGKSTYARTSVWTATMVDKGWTNLTDGNPTNGSIQNTSTSYDNNGTVIDAARKWYYDLSSLTEIEQISLFNYISWGKDLEICNFELYVSNDTGSLWNADNKAVAYEVAQNKASKEFNIINIKFNEIPKGRYIGFFWDYPACFRTKNATNQQSAVVLSEIALFGNQSSAITASSGNGGTITPVGITEVANGGEAIYTVKADKNSTIKEILVDGVAIDGAVGKTEYTYTFTNVTSNHTITAEFESDYTVTNDLCNVSELQGKYSALVSEYGKDVISGKEPKGFAGNLDHNFIDKTADWGSLSDGDSSNSTFANIDGRFYSHLYFKLDKITDIEKIVLANNLLGQQALQIASFDIFVGNNTDTLWDETNIVASYNKSAETASGKNADFITVAFEKQGLAKGRYIGFRWNEPYNFKNNSGGVVLTEIAAFGTEFETVSAVTNGSGNVYPVGSTELSENVEYTFVPDKNYKISDVVVDGVSKGISKTYTVVPDGHSHNIEVEFTVKGDIDNDRILSANDLVFERKHLLGLQSLDFCYTDVNSDGDTNILDLVSLKKLLTLTTYEEDIEMLVKGLGLSYFDIQDAIERADNLNEVSGSDASRIQNVMQKAKRGENITIAVIGGSITEGAYKTVSSGYASADVNSYFGNMCYAEWLEKWFEDTFYNGDTSKVTLVNAGIGATPSFLGSFRLQSMVIEKNPDLAIVEFSVNDFSTISYPSSEIYLGDKAYEAYESIVRRLLEKDIAVMQLFMGHTQERGLWNIHRVIGAHYKVPMISFENAVYPNDTCIVGTETSRIYADGVHPNNVGHAFVGKTVSSYLDKLNSDTQLDQEYEKAAIPEDCVYGDTYINENNTILYADDNKTAVSGSFSYKATASGLSSKWNGAWYCDGTGKGSISLNIPAGVEAVYALYYPTANGSLTSKLGSKDAVTVDYTAVSRMSWSSLYNGAPISADTCLTVSSDSSGLYIVGIMLQYADYTEVYRKMSIEDIEYKTQGRTFLVDNKGLALEYTAASFEFNAYCTGDVSLDIELSNLVSETEERGIYFTVFVDGVKQDRMHLYGTGKHSLKIAENLELGNHSFEIYRQTEIEHGTAYISGINLKGEITAAPQNADKLIQVIGASSVAGYGNLGNTSTDTAIAGYPIYEDGTQSFAFLLAQKLGADVDVIAQQGIGVQYGWRNANMQTVYGYRNYQHDTVTEFDFENSRTPDAIVISLGGNDISSLEGGGLGANITKDDTAYTNIQNGMKAFLLSLRNLYPNANIIWEIGVVASSSNEMGAEIIKNAVNEAGGNSSGFYFVDMRDDNITNIGGAKNHPSAEEHGAFADVLYNFINENDLLN